MTRGVGHRRDPDVEVISEVEVERGAVQSWNCGDDDARGGGAHGGGDAHSMRGTSAEAAIVGLAQDRYGDRSEYVAASESAYVAVAVVVELYNASAAAAAVVVVVVACAIMRIPTPAPSAQFPLSRVHLARTWVHWDARFPSLAPSH
jgi:hypothetical protein